MLPLRLSLDPIVPDRMPAQNDDLLDYGYRLRLPGGPVIAVHDAALAAHGAMVVPLYTTSEHEQALQDDRFEPGCVVRLLAEPFDGERPGSVRVWDADAVLDVGELPQQAAALALAGIELGLEPRAVVLAEVRALTDHRRAGLELLVHAPALLTVDPPPARGFLRPARPMRPRVVLYADGSADIRWWDPAGARGPADVDDLPVSAELVEQLRRLREAYRALDEEESLLGEVEGVEVVERTWAREELDRRAVRLWRRAQSELGRRYAVGFLGPDMLRPAWSPSALEGEDDDWLDEVPV